MMNFSKDLENEIIQHFSEYNFSSVKFESHYYEDIFLEITDNNKQELRLSLTDEDYTIRFNNGTVISKNKDNRLIRKEIVKYIRENLKSEDIINNIMKELLYNIDSIVNKIELSSSENLRKRYKKYNLKMYLLNFHNFNGDSIQWVDPEGLGFGWAYRFKKHLSRNKNLIKNGKILKQLFNKSISNLSNYDKIYEISINDNSKILVLIDLEKILNKEDNEFILGFEHISKVFYFSKLPITKFEEKYIF